MEEKDPYLSLIEDALGRLTLKYKSEFKYELNKTKLGHSFTIFEGNSPIHHKEFPEIENFSKLHYQIIRDFITSGIERILMQRENEKRLFPKSHASVSENKIHTTKSNW